MNQSKKFTLMNKNVPVADMLVNIDMGYIEKIIKTYNPEYYPVMVSQQKDNVKITFLREWLDYRSIPGSRLNIRETLREMGVANTRSLSIRNLGLNLSDQYWFKPDGVTLSWDDVNLFHNTFEARVYSSRGSNPDTGSNGELPKFWKIGDDGLRYLYKRGTGPYYQQPYNELFASLMLKKANIPHATYNIEKINDVEYSVCPTFIDENSEYVSAYQVINAIKKKSNINNYQHFLSCIEELNIQHDDEFIGNMLVFDYMIANSDRHYGNFGFIRDVNTLEFKGFAPLFDSGNSLWYDSVTKKIRNANMPAKPFIDNHNKQIELVKSFSEALLQIKEDDIHQIALKSLADNDNFDDSRVDVIISRVMDNINDLRDMFI